MSLELAAKNSATGEEETTRENELENEQLLEDCRENQQEECIAATAPAEHGEGFRITLHISLDLPSLP